MRWPHRKVKSLQKNIDQLAEEKKRFPESNAIDDQLEKYQREKDFLVRNPEYYGNGKAKASSSGTSSRPWNKRSNPDMTDDEDEAYPSPKRSRAASKDITTAIHHLPMHTQSTYPTGTYGQQPLILLPNGTLAPASSFANGPFYPAYYPNMQMWAPPTTTTASQFPH